MGWMPRWPYLALVASRLAVAQVIVNDGFESGGFSQWNGVSIIEPANVIEVDAGAARNGLFGLLLDDRVGMGGFGGQNSIYLSLDAGTRDLEVRFSLRMTASNDTGSYAIPLWVRTAGTVRSAGELVVLFPGATLRLQGVDRLNTQTAVTLDASVGRSWQDIRFVIRGMNTDAGARELWLDGVQRAAQSVDFSGMQPATLELGAPFAARVWVGVLHFDDVLVSTQPGDGGAFDAGPPDAGGLDGGTLDSGVALDAGASDAGGNDAGSNDAGTSDAGTEDGGVDDDGGGGGYDAAVRDAGMADGGAASLENYSVGCGCSSSPLVVLTLLAVALRRRPTARRHGAD